MATTPFTPANGVKARWRYCYELVTSREKGDEITLAEVMALLDDCDEATAWAAMREARDHLEADGRRSVDTVPGYGWRVATATVQIRMAGDRTKKARRQVKKAIRVIHATPRDELTQFERQTADRQVAMLTAMADLHARRVKRSLSDMAQDELQPQAFGT